MKALLALVCGVYLTAAAACLDAAKPREPVALTLTGPSVVIFHATGAEIERIRTEERGEDEYKSFKADFDNGSARLTAALKRYPQIKVMVSSADVVRFADPSVPPVWRYSVPGGFGYLLYQPGRPVRVYSGVRSGDGLACEAARLFTLKPLPPRCDPVPDR
jgi:hypothetical protein